MCRPTRRSGRGTGRCGITPSGRRRTSRPPPPGPVPRRERVSSDLLEFLRERIRAHGPMPFAAYMSHVLYHPRHGYYAAGPERSGWRGHFLTSPELDPSFGALWAHAFEEIWDACGRPPEFTIVEIGPGEAGFARGVLGAV